MFYVIYGRSYEYINDIKNNIADSFFIKVIPRDSKTKNYCKSFAYHLRK
jgi:hypothetical protein